LNLSGKRLGPEEMESAAVQVQGVAEVAAVQIPSKDNEVNVVCFVVLSPEGQDISNDPAFPSAVTAAVGAALGKAFRPSLVVLVEELPKTRSGKVVRRAVRSVCAGVDPGDLSSLENPEVLPRIADSFHAAVGLDSGTAGS
jgi:acetyl-CoA synthetase